ncbi:MAG: UDP-3-O-(3-hydroxymyristoyl)glucosamine N-acyltransferase [Ignavibacteria bacterium]|jgi:UDP-3-O-[3-hydroxymyristoyl] glucosamine N-acyltransferase|nr:UDP-3-O-(3-hydroxymyristoyl)glucosamine N-acyltransferase [Ignavibacteria bacterium]MCU7504121.1 UDP-3-O-(3-hydroxymyristoyl)glucosamine N-acyltransferase [Ignavibacteria bacterium]MCU7516429.1 UDP-3-O-(3-hydroxymyristoyl)glucosamine N-acyltransferase [Ignavibacteria bacterium]
MEIKLKDVADLVGGNIIGDENVIIENIAKIEEAKKNDLTFLYHPSYEKYFSNTQASAILVKPDFPKSRTDITYIEVKSPNAAFLNIVNHFFKPEFRLTGIDDSAYIAPGVSVGNSTALGKNVVVSEGCKLGSNVKIFHNCVLLENVEIGDDTIIFPNVTIREGCKIGSRAIIHSGSVIGSDGFGYSPDANGVYHKIPQIGIVVLEDDVELGANVTVDRAALGATVIKKGTKLDNLVQIAHNVQVGENTVMSAQTGVSGSTKIGRNCILAGQVGVVGHIELADNVIVGAKSGVSKSLPKAGTYWGSPAKELKAALRLEGHVRNLPSYADKIKEMEKQIKELKELISTTIESKRNK